MLWIHPLFMAATSFFLAYSLWSGGKRLLSKRMKSTRFVFAWKRHVRCGVLLLALWLVGMVGGMIMVKLFYGEALLFRRHIQGAVVVLVLGSVALVTGLIMHRKKQQRRILPVVHALNNIGLTAAFAWQADTGWDLVNALLIR